MIVVLGDSSMRRGVGYRRIPIYNNPSSNPTYLLSLKCIAVSTTVHQIFEYCDSLNLLWTDEDPQVLELASPQLIQDVALGKILVVEQLVKCERHPGVRQRLWSADPLGYRGGGTYHYQWEIWEGTDFSFKQSMKQWWYSKDLKQTCIQQYLDHDL